MNIVSKLACVVVLSAAGALCAFADGYSDDNFVCGIALWRHSLLG